MTDAPPRGASAPVPAAQGAAGPAPAAPSLPLLPLSPPTGTHAGPAPHAPPHHGPASPGTSPLTLDPGPGPLAVACNLILNAPDFVPLNADDDNGSPITQDPAGLPAKRDYQVWPIPNNGQGDPELKDASVTVNCNVPGTLSWIITDWAGGDISLWTDNQKTQPAANNIPLAGNSTLDFDIEGDHESLTYRDVTLTFSYTFNVTGTPQTVQDQHDITVTPVVNSFTATEAPGQNVRFDGPGHALGADGTLGLMAMTPGDGPGIVWAASAGNTSLTGVLTFVQDVESLRNGGASNTGNPGWTYQPNAHDLNPGGNNRLLVSANAVVADSAPLPLLDAPPGFNMPDYEFGGTVRDTPTPPAGTTTITASDSPFTGNPLMGPLGVRVDVELTFSLWLMWRYPNLAGGYVYYPLAKVNWQADFLGHASTSNNNGPVGPINTIDIPHGVTVDPAGPRLTNQPPDTMRWTTTVNGQTVSNLSTGNLSWAESST